MARKYLPVEYWHGRLGRTVRGPKMRGGRKEWSAMQDAVADEHRVANRTDAGGKRREREGNRQSGASLATTEKPAPVIRMSLSDCLEEYERVAAQYFPGSAQWVRAWDRLQCAIARNAT